MVERSSEGRDNLDITARCFDGTSITVKIGSGERVADLKSALQRITGTHAAAQRLVFAGSTLRDADLVGDVLVGGATIFMLALKTFPAALGPFEAVGTPFVHRDFELPPLDSPDFLEQGAVWIMEHRAAARHGIRGAFVEFPLCGQISPPHPVTLSLQEKESIGIPAAASSFVFSYPVVSPLATAAAAGSATEAARSFLSVGGYAYLDASGKIIHTTTLVPAARDTGGLQFKSGQSWHPEWTRALMKAGRFQRVTVQAFNEIGAHHFCWLRPGEVIIGEDGAACAEQPKVPHGGFAYLFHTDIFSSRPEELHLDKYFAIASGDDYLPDEAGDEACLGERAATFALVSSMAQVEDLVAEHTIAEGEAARAPESEDEGQLRARIGALEQQLDSVTKCVACLVEDKDTMLLPCSHLCMCAGCAGRITRCPVCRASVNERRQTFL